DLELPYGLFDEHLDSGDCDLLLFSRAADQRGVDRIVDQIEYDIDGNGAIEEAAFYLREHAEGSRVDDGVEMMFGEVFPDKRQGAAGFGQGAYAIGIAAGKGDARPGIHQGAGGSAGSAAVADDEHAGFSGAKMAREGRGYSGGIGI